MIVPVYILFFTLSFISLSVKLKNKNEIIFTLFIIYFSCIIIAVFRSSDTLDYQIYYEAFKYNKLERAEIGYQITMTLIRKISDSFKSLLFIMAATSIGIKLIAIRYFSNNILLSLIVYISNILLLHDMIQMRAAIASGLILFAIFYSKNRQLFKFLLCIIIGTLFHQSMLAIAPIWFLRSNNIKYKLWILLIPIGYCLAITNNTIGHLVSYIPIPIIQNSYHQYQLAMDAGMFSAINIFNTVLILRVIICITILIKIKDIQTQNKQAILWIKLYSLGIFSLLVFSDIQVIAVRLSELFFVIEIVLFPLLIYIFPRKSQNIGKLSVISISLLMLLVNTFYIHLLV